MYVVARGWVVDARGDETCAPAQNLMNCIFLESSQVRDWMRACDNILR
jgi:hypothetical protein